MLKSNLKSCLQPQKMNETCEGLIKSQKIKSFRKDINFIDKKTKK